MRRIGRPPPERGLNLRPSFSTGILVVRPSQSYALELFRAYRLWIRCMSASGAWGPESVGLNYGPRFCLELTTEIRRRRRRQCRPPDRKGRSPPDGRSQAVALTLADGFNCDA